MNRTRTHCCLVALLLLLAPFAAAGAAADSSPAASPALLAKLGRGVALALDTPEFRQRLVAELEATPYVEQRIRLKQLLADDEPLRKDVLRQAGIAEAWHEVAPHLPELELYFPMASHRETWNGSDEIQVAVAVGGQEEVYRIFSRTGAEGRLDLGIDPLPQAPTLLVGPSEIDYDDLESALVGGSRTGGYLLALAEQREALRSESGTQSLTAASCSPSGSLDTSRHTYLTYFRIYGDHDTWGSNEIEIFGSVDGAYGECQRFTDIANDGSLYLPAPGSSGSKKIAYAVPVGSNTVDVRVYEDDDTGCVVKSDDDYLGTANLQITQYGTIYGTSNGQAAVRVETFATCCGDNSCGGNETASNCCADCASCGNGVCNTSCGESYSNCPGDCTCGNGVCDWNEDSWSCPGDCGSCGNGLCEPSLGEDEFTCNLDCCGSRLCPQ